MINYAGNAGTEKYVDVLEREYRKLGHICYLAYNVAGKLSSDLQERGVRSLRLDLDKSGLKTAPRLIAAYCKENEIDVIHVQYPRENIYAIKSLKYYKKPKVVFTSHLSIKQGFKWQILNRIYTRKNHAVIALYDDAKDLLIKNGVCKKKIQIVYNGVELQSDTALYKKDPFKMCIMARYEPEKGLDFLIDSLARLKEKTTENFVVDILGEGEYFDRITRRRKELGLEMSVNQVGYTKKTKEYLLNSSLYLCSSENEAMSFSILEAFSYGLPCVATDVGGNYLLVNINGVSGKLVNYGDTEAFSDAIKAYMDNEALWDKDSKAAKNKIEQVFSLEMLAKNTLKVYE